VEAPVKPATSDRRRWFILVFALVIIGLGWYLARALREAQSAVPLEVPQAAEMTTAEFDEAESEYVASLKTKNEREAFEKGKVLYATKAQTWGQDTRNMGESNYAESQSFSRRETEAFAMGLHFAHGKAHNSSGQ